MYPVEGGCSNPYNYAFSDPINAFDLNGQKCSKKVGAAAKAAGYGDFIRAGFDLAHGNSDKALREIFGNLFTTGVSSGAKKVALALVRAGSVLAKTIGKFFFVLGVGGTLVDLFCHSGYDAKPPAGQLDQGPRRRSRRARRVLRPGDARMSTQGQDTNRGCGCAAFIFFVLLWIGAVVLRTTLEFNDSAGEGVVTALIVLGAGVLIFVLIYLWESFRSKR